MLILHEACWIPRTASAREIQLALVPDRQYANHALLGQKAIERDIAGLSIGNDQLAYLTFEAPADQRVIRKNLDDFTDSNSRIPCCGRIVLCRKRECPPDGKWVVIGFSSNAPNNDFALARYNSDGTLDTDFGTGGKVTTNFGAYDVAFAVALAGDKIVVAGHFFDGGVGGDAFALARYNANGSLDTTFDGDGMVKTKITGALDAVRAVAIQTDGKIVAAGRSFNNLTITDFILVRYNTDGSLDTSFNTTGKVTTDIGGDFDEVSALVLQSDGKIVAAGSSWNRTTLNDDFSLVRYNTNGSLDIDFGVGGKVMTDFSGRDDHGVSLVQQPDQKFLVAGRSSGTSNVFALARYNANGSLDTSFGMDGKVMTDIGDSLDQAQAVALQSDGKIVAAGISSLTNGDFVLVRYNVGGSIDTTFGTAGIVQTDFGNTNDEVFTLVIQPDGKAIAAGVSNGKFALARYLP